MLYSYTQSFKLIIKTFILSVSIILLYLSHSTHLSAQYRPEQRENFFIRNYGRQDFNASLSNWDVTQDENGIVYIANYDGILVFDSKSWKNIPIKNNLIGLSIGIDLKNRIFVGTLGDFGYLKPDTSGKLTYNSLRKKLPQDLILKTFWKIVPTKSGVFFHSADLIVKWSPSQVSYWKSDSSKYRFAFGIQDTLFTSQREKGILKLANSTFKFLPKTKPLAEKGVSFITDYKSDSLIVGLTSGEFYSIRNNNIPSPISVDTKTETYLYKNFLYSGIKTKSSSKNRYILATSTGGIVVLDSSLMINNIINKLNGLSSDAIRSIYTDQAKNLWTAMNGGISTIELESPWKHCINNSKVIENINTIIRHRKELYIGNSDGLMKLESTMSQKTDQRENKVWDLFGNSKSLFVACQDGLFILNNDNFEEILNFPPVTQLDGISINDTTFLLLGHNGGVTVLYEDQRRWKEYNTYEIPAPAFKSIVYFKNKLWASAKFNGLYSIQRFPHHAEELITKYDTTSGLPDINEIKIIKKDDQLLFTTSKGFYRYNEQTNRFEPDSSILKERININNIAEDKYGNYIISVIDENRKTHVEMLKKVGNEYVRDYIPFRRLPEMEITAIYPEGDYIWIAGGEGLFRFDRNVKKDYTIPFNTLVSQVSVRDSVIFYGNYYDPSDTTGVPPIILDQPEIFKPKLEFEDNSLTFNFSAAFYEAPERTLYSYYLENNEETWSKWSTSTTKEYNNLSAGTYTFHVKSKNIYDTEGRVASYEFTILPPWYQTGWAYFLFGMLALLFIWLIALLYTYRVRMQRRRLKLIVADRTYEVISQKKEIERQKDLLQLQFEKISKQKDSIEEKNSKLLYAQQETQNANEALQKLNAHLEKEVEKRTEKIKSTLHQLQLKNKELDTFIYRASHDLEGPISRISGLSALVKMAFPKDANQQYLDLIEVTAKNMKVLISKLTQVHNLHNAVVRRELIDIKELFTSIIQSLQHLESGSSIEYTFDIPEEMKIYGDADLLSIILQNIIENALVFRKPRGEEQHIIISAGVADHQAYLTIRDCGTGIHPDHISKVFDMFYRGTSLSLGSGLGLYLAKMAIDHLEGKIEVRSKLHEYTEFTVIIPQPSGDVGG